MSTPLFPIKSIFYGGRNCEEGKKIKTNQLDMATAARVASDNNRIVYFGGTTLTLVPLRSSDNLCTLSAIMSEGGLSDGRFFRRRLMGI